MVDEDVNLPEERCPRRSQSPEERRPRRSIEQLYQQRKRKQSECV